MSLRDQLQSTLGAELQVATAGGCNIATAARPKLAPPVRAEYKHVTAARLSSDLAAAIRQACRARGESDALCQALISDCTDLTRAHQLDLMDHFRGEARRTGRIQPQSGEN
jgi:hypothetical protein